MAKRLQCTVTGNWSYCSDGRYKNLVKKFGSEAKLKAGYISRLGKQIQKGDAEKPDEFANKIRCTVTGRLCYISNERMKRLAKKAGSQAKVRETYVSRVARRLLKDGKNKTEIREMAKNGTLPEPTELKARKVVKARKGRTPRKGTRKTVVIDATPKHAPATAAATAG